MSAFENGGVYVAIYFLCVAASALIAAIHWSARFRGNVSGLAVALLSELALRTFMVGALTIGGVAAILIVAFPSATPMILVHLAKNLILGVAVVAPVALLSHVLFGSMATRSGIAALTAMTALVYVAVALGMHALNDHLLAKAARDRQVQEAARQERARHAALRLETRAQALRKRQPIVPSQEPYVSVYRCIEPILTDRSAHYASRQAWPDSLPVIQQMTGDPRCRIRVAGLDAGGGGIWIRTEDETLPPWGRKVAKKAAPHDPPPPPLDIYFLPVIEQGAVARWLCTAPHQPQIATRFSGCGFWTPSPVEWLASR